MSAEEFDKLIEKAPITEGLKRALEELARRTVREGLDPVKVVVHLTRFLTAWQSLTPEQREAVRAELRRRRVSRVPQRKPRRYGEQR